jgi:hypothetical protein
MALSAFDDGEAPPREDDLMTVLEKAGPLWTAFVDGVGERVDGMRPRWIFSGAKYGWSLRLMKGDRILTYVTPQQGRFLVGVVLGEKALGAQARAGLRPAALKIIDDAPRYAEGRGIRVTVANRRDLVVALQIAALKPVS